MASSSSSVPSNYGLIRVWEYPEDDTIADMAAEFQATGSVERAIFPIPLTQRMKQDMETAPEILLPLNLQNHSQYAIEELMKLYNAGERNCVMKLPEKFPYDTQMKLWDSLEETLPQLMTDKDDETGKLRRLRVYYVKED